MFPSKSKHIKRARRTLIPSQNLLPKAFQPVYIAMHCSACSSRQVYRKCSENSSCGQNYVENGPLFNHFDFGDTLLCAEALLTSTLSLLPPQSAAYANRCQLFFCFLCKSVPAGGDAAKIAAFQCFALAPAVCLLMQVSCWFMSFCDVARQAARWS